MKQKRNLLNFVWFIGISFVIQLAIQNKANAQFSDDFSSPTLDPAWTVVQTWPGGDYRPGGYNLPGNHYSLTDNPGYLRYWLDPMTHYDGFLIEYESYQYYYWYDAGLEIHREFSGDKWLFEAGGIFNLPETNGRGLILRLYFGDGEPGTYFVFINRGVDVTWNGFSIRLNQTTGTEYTDQNVIKSYWDPWHYGENNYPTPTPQYYRVKRDGGVLTTFWSDDGQTWNTAWSHDLGTSLNGLEQRVVLTGICWFNPAGSYADWDYISLTPTVIPVLIDIKPGNFPNPIPLNSKTVIPVAILTDNNFDATTVDPLSVEFGPNGAKARASNGHIKDVDADGDLDMVLQFNTSETGIQCGEIEASLTGTTTNGENIAGTDAIVTVACKLKSATIEQAKESLKEGYALYQNYPNPFNSETEISFYLPEDNHVLLNIFNINGKIIQTLVNGRCSAGEHKIRWSGTDYNGTPVADGLYFYRLKTDSFNKVEKMSLIR